MPGFLVIKTNTPRRPIAGWRGIRMVSEGSSDKQGKAVDCRDGFLKEVVAWRLRFVAMSD